MNELALTTDFHAALHGAAPRLRRRRAALAAGSVLAIAAAVAAATLALTGGAPSIAARAYAAVSGGEVIIHTVQRPPAYTAGRRRVSPMVETWYDPRTGDGHTIMRTNGEVTSDVARRDGIQFARMGDDAVRRIDGPRLRPGIPDPADPLTQFRYAYRHNRVVAMGTASLDGRQVERIVFEVGPPPGDQSASRPRLHQIWYLDPDTSAPLEVVAGVRGPGANALAGSATTRFTTFERLPRTPANLRLPADRLPLRGCGTFGVVEAPKVPNPPGCGRVGAVSPRRPTARAPRGVARRPRSRPCPRRAGRGSTPSPRCRDGPRACPPRNGAGTRRR